ncbi:unnamed protein product [Caenorhabditis bovis]|uniref:Uncharacterized protein n=1 Tax=Caenorhabditis bovis TaxID=2654633 RepID=A0A8S1EJW4_9PELO|nr:unnamed protein product [Caenorhabditis bovis]
MSLRSHPYQSSRRGEIPTSYRAMLIALTTKSNSLSGADKKLYGCCKSRQMEYIQNRLHVTKKHQEQIDQLSKIAKTRWEFDAVELLKDILHEIRNSEFSLIRVSEPVQAFRREKLLLDMVEKYRERYIRLFPNKANEDHDEIVPEDPFNARFGTRPL